VQLACPLEEGGPPARPSAATPDESGLAGEGEKGNRGKGEMSRGGVLFVWGDASPSGQQRLNYESAIDPSVLLMKESHDCYPYRCP